MKVLFVYNFILPDYQADCVYHGLVDSGFEVYETANPFYMLASHPNPKEIYGNGFTLFAKLDYRPRLEEPSQIIEKIKSRFYDQIIYGCIYPHDISTERQCLDYLEYVKEYYPRNRVHFIDGADDRKNFAYKYGLNEYGIVWKRELRDWDFGNPISFAIPESQILKQKVEKEFIFSPTLGKPNMGNATDSLYDRHNYKFTREQDYYDQYAKAYYGHTCKKIGWDCMRHYEILANNCIPLFPNLEDCPPTTLANFPKWVILETNKYSKYEYVHPQYSELCEYLFDYTKKNLTTKKLVEKFL